MRMDRKLALVTVAAAMAAVGCGSGGVASEVSASEDAPTRVITVEVVTIAPSAFTDQVRLTGTVEAQRDVTVSGEESGVIRALYVRKGQPVSAGQAIAKIDDRVLQAQLDQAASEARLAAETWERHRRLWEEEQVGSEMAYLRAKYAAETASAAARGLAARLDRTVIRAPISGILDARVVEVGAMVAPGSPVARIVDLDTVKVVAGVPERFSAEIRRGASTRVVLDALGGREYEGVIEFVGAALNEQNRTFPVEIAVPNRAGDIKPGMVANVAIARQTLAEALTIPQEAVVRGEAGYIVFVAAEEGGVTVAQPRSVVLGPSQLGRVVITAGLAAGDRVIVVGQQQVAGGDRLQVIEHEVSRRVR
jgi:membrane fusion protein, multidrug efflux system